MGDRLPAENDVIILGTGMPESIIAASLSRIDQKVLHIDSFDFYGGCWGSFSLRNFRKFLQFELEVGNECSKINLEEIKLEVGEKLLDIFQQPKIITNVKEYPKISEIEIKDDFPNFNWMKLHDNSPKNLDFQNVDLNKSINQDDNDMSELDHTLEQRDQILERDFKSNEEVKENIASSSSLPEDVTEADTQEDVKATSSPPPQVSVDDVISMDRKFHIDLVSKLLYNRGNMVELLISSDVARYCEFKIVSRVLTLLDGAFQIVPCSKSDVFATTAVGVFEKRLLMKFLTMALTFNEKPQEYEGFESKKFSEFLDHKKLTRTLKHFIQHAIAMVTDEATTLEGLAATQKYLLSLGRYGNSSFLFPMYGMGELIQCFCRLSAVFGGTYCLKRGLEAVVVDSNNNLTSVIDSTGDRLNTKWLVVDPMYIKPDFLLSNCHKRLLSRAIIITNKSLLTDADNHITLCNIGGGAEHKNILMQELSSLALTCPEPFYLVHLTCESTSSDAQSDLMPFVQEHFNCSEITDCSADIRPHVLWLIYFNIESIHVDTPLLLFNHILITSNPDAQLDCDRPIKEAEEVFKMICPDQPFLPRAPRPEEIIYGDEGTGKIVNEETGKMVDETGKMVDEETGKMVDETGKMVDEETGKMVDEETGKMVDERAGKMVDEEVGKMVDEEVGKMVDPNEKSGDGGLEQENNNYDARFLVESNEIS